ncbi:DNA polymerase III subunit beta [Sorangium cellulosum]|uniref:Beta sliding clamp n=1 Tax=Sorangium cellulosum TaxID=56 RepID=A0A150RYP6_SORCE|nr:DNA polymerase III subunit beta [Sorangium cellulosum]KYF98436.1 DNA polymerase III subunit beta [Sorangium cellulosum]KYG09142.1 DNA polymerase III subunit beta [Sorangium cellulosum]
MDLVIPKKDLLRLVARCQGVADKKSAMPALANVLLAADGNAVRVAATDLYLGVTGQTHADIKTGGTVAVPARDLLERVKAMPDGPIQITTTEGAHTSLKAVGSPRRYTLPGLPGSEFPQLPAPSRDAPSLELPVEQLALLIARTHFSISTDETRAHVNSALFEWAGDRVRMVTTDGHRLSKMEATVSGSSATATMLIPLKAITELRRLAEEARAEKETPMVAITQSGPNAFFNIAGMQFSVKLVDAQFPPYQQVIPSVTERSVRAPRVQFAEALRAIALAANDRTGGVKLSIAPGTLRITSESPDTGAGFDEVAVDYAGPEVTIGFNAKYFLDVLGSIDDEEVILGISGELDPAVIRPGGESNQQSYVAVVMPMRI